MSLYNYLFKENEDATALLGMIDCTREMFGRYRDVYLNKEGTEITVLTRLGGSNRENIEIKRIFINIRSLPYYISDTDDSYDNTYCYIKFKVPERYIPTCVQMAPEKDEPTIKEKFDKELEEAEKLGTPAYERRENLMKQLRQQIDEDPTSGLKIIRF